jgi:hypothetical protein
LLWALNLGVARIVKRYGREQSVRAEEMAPSIFESMQLHP